jgi:hypothetical protein
VDPVPDPLLLRKSGSAGNRTRTSGPVARNSGYYSTEAVGLILKRKKNIIILETSCSHVEISKSIKC